ncbi:MAG: DNA polymerase III subunit gamma/tau [Clostridiales Family XIII bacterium]|jgi:DNA polymerase-3 subunit gamma/tau|nr:DNA polymerase III subunit gamma/tau [Clostridiales Family XIII bacterium]
MSDKNYEAIYRRFRPATFGKVLGQAHIVNVLRRQIAADEAPHAYLFAGTRGTGKTTMARLLAKGLNCLADGDRPCGVCENCVSIQNGAFVDVIEIDAASNNGVADVRQIRDSVVYPPTVGRKRVYIIDEAHMLTAAANNAFLKTLEEPPENTVFILATTEPGKMLATIRSRCLLFEFKRVPAAVIADGMKDIVKELGTQADDDALALIAANADGSVRDALSILEQCTSLGRSRLTRDDVLESIGSAGDDAVAELSEKTLAGDTAAALILFNEILKAGKDVRRVMEDWIDYLRSALLIKYLGKPETILNRSLDSIKEIRERTAGADEKKLAGYILKLSKLYNESRWSAHPGILAEMLIIELSEKSSEGEN